MSGTEQIVFGLGSGRSGTASLAGLLNAQPNVVCFHEINPAAMAWESAEDTVASLLRGFHDIMTGAERVLTIDRTVHGRTAAVPRMKSLEAVTGMGDVAHYYLPYVEMILGRVPDARFPCLHRDREEVVQSFIAKLRLKPHGKVAHLHARLKGRHLPTSRNHWAGPGDNRWQSDHRFDKCFPSYEGLRTADLAAHLRRWHDDYYARIETLVSRYPDNVRVFDMACLNDSTGRRDLLDFALPGTDVDPDVSVHANARAVTR